MTEQKLKIYKFWVIFQLIQFTGMFGIFLGSNISDGIKNDSYEELFGFSALYVSTIVFLLLVYNWKKHRDFVDRRFSTPVAPDGHELPKISRELDRMMYEESRQPSVVDLMTIKYFIYLVACIFIGLLTTYLLVPNFSLTFVAIVGYILFTITTFLFFLYRKVKRKYIILQIKNNKTERNQQ